jgi:hypothetical protein
LAVVLVSEFAWVEVSVVAASFAVFFFFFLVVALESVWV